MFYKVVHKAEDISSKVNRVIARSVAAIIAVVVVLIVIDVVGRKLFNHPLPGSTEITAACLSYIAFMSYAYGLITNSYVKVEVFYLRFPRTLRIIIDIFTCLCGLLVFYVIIKGGWAMFYKSFVAKELMPASVDFPYWLPKMFVPLGSFFMIIQCFIQCLGSICKFIEKEDTAHE